jgi:molecular chaperone GrpE
MMTETFDDRPDLTEKLAELEILRQSLEAAQAKEKETYDQLLRLGAEFENFRKRTEARVQDARRFGKEDVLIHLISLGDALSQAEVATLKAPDVESIKKGMALIFQAFERFLKDQGLVPIKSVGEKLDPHLHEAIAQEATDDHEEGTIVDEIQKGYTLSGHVVRPARVRVAVKKKSPEVN